MAVPIDDQIAEVARELALRKNVYPTFVVRKRMTQAEADLHMARMEGVIATLNWLKKLEATPEQIVSALDAQAEEVE